MSIHISKNSIIDQEIYNYYYANAESRSRIKAILYQNMIMERAKNFAGMNYSYDLGCNYSGNKGDSNSYNYNNNYSYKNSKDHSDKSSDSYNNSRSDNYSNSNDYSDNQKGEDIDFNNIDLDDLDNLQDIEEAKEEVNNNVDILSLTMQIK